MIEYAVPLLVITALIVANGLFVAAEFAVVAAPRLRIVRRAEDGSRAAQRVAAIQRDPDRQNRYLATAQVGITVVSLGLGMYGEHAVAGWLIGPLEGLGRLSEPAAHTVALVLSIAFLTYLHVVLGEMIPKSLAIQTAETTVLRVAAPMAALERILAPVVVLLNGLGNVITRLLGVPPFDAAERLLSPSELEIAVRESVQRGLIHSGDYLILENIFDFGERTVGQVMTPRNRVQGLAVEATEEAVQRRLCETRFSRFPVFEGSLDQIVGVLHVKDLARQRVHGAGPLSLRRLVRRPLFLPESLPLEDALMRLRRDRTSIAIVFDEFGGTAGLVTIEDVVEEVVGEIRDEFDREIPPLQVLEPRLLRARGDVILEEIGQHFGVTIDHPEAETVGGLVMAELGRIAADGDVVSFGGVRFEVETVDGLAVQTVLAMVPESEEAPGGPRGAEGERS